MIEKMADVVGFCRIVGFPEEVASRAALELDSRGPEYHCKEC